MSADSIFGWIAIGLAASLAGMIWPFRRGALGVVVNLLAGSLGALLAGSVSYALFPSTNHGETPHLFSAALGAIAALGLVHAVWTRIVSSRRGHEAPER